MKKKLKLSRETLKNLTSDRLDVAGGKAGAGTHYATVCWACDTTEDPCIPSGGAGLERGLA